MLQRNFFLGGFRSFDPATSSYLFFCGVHDVSVQLRFFLTTVLVTNSMPSCLWKVIVARIEISRGWGREGLCLTLHCPHQKFTAFRWSLIGHSYCISCGGVSWFGRAPGGKTHGTLALIQDTAAWVGTKSQRRQSDRCMIPTSALTY